VIIEFLIFRLLYSRCGIDNIAVSERFRSLFSDKINATELVTFVPPSSGPFRFFWICRTLCAVRCRKSVSNPRGGGRIAYRRCCPFGCEEKTLPGCRLRNSPIHSTSHPNGVRLGAIRRQLKALDTLTIFYHQRRMEFRVVWIKLLEGTKEYQVGLKAFAQEREAWGLSSSPQPMSRATTTASA